MGKKLHSIFCGLLIANLFFANNYLLQLKEKQYQDLQKDYEYLALFSEMAAMVKKDYVEIIDPRQKFPAAFSALLSALDNYSAYLDSTSSSIFKKLYADAGDLYGLGIFGTVNRNYFLITDVLKNSPAAKAGLKIGQFIKSVNGLGFFNKSFWDMYLRLFSLDNKPIHLVIFKEKFPETFELTIKPEKINPEINFTILANSILYIQLNCFNESNFIMLADLLKNENKYPICLDLRCYQSGDFTNFKKIAEILLTQKINLKLKSKHSNQIVELNPMAFQNHQGVVIVNESTILYGELLARCLQCSRKNDNQWLLIGQPINGFVCQFSQIFLNDNTSIVLTEALFELDSIPCHKFLLKPDIQIPVNQMPHVISKSVDILKNHHYNIE
jgi:carboxyl-terminal processing protease